jgi:hypothetical protein
MRNTNFARRAIALSVAAAGSLLSFLLSFLLFAPSASALVVKPIGGGSSTAVAPSAAPSAVHNIVIGGMAGWQIALIAGGAALLAATVTVFMDRVRTAHQGLKVSAA